MFLCDAVDGVLFEDQQEQGFEDVEHQWCFEEGKWSLIMLVVPNNSSNILIYFICMHVSII